MEIKLLVKFNFKQWIFIDLIRVGVTNKHVLSILSISDIIYFHIDECDDLSTNLILKFFQRTQSVREKGRD